jgi:hypothetical protein
LHGQGSAQLLGSGDVKSAPLSPQAETGAPQSTTTENYSGTNNQVAGVDETDLVKSDGRVQTLVVSINLADLSRDTTVQEFHLAGHEIRYLASFEVPRQALNQYSMDEPVITKSCQHSDSFLLSFLLALCGTGLLSTPANQFNSKCFIVTRCHWADPTTSGSALHTH